jgi:hypothetical protein
MIGALQGQIETLSGNLTDDVATGLRVLPPAVRHKRRLREQLTVGP